MAAAAGGTRAFSGRYFEGRRCLVAGGTGFIGSHVADALADAGADVGISVHRRASPGPDRAAWTTSADFRQREDCLRALQGVDTLVHAAGGVGAAGVGPSSVLLGAGDYVQITANLLWAAAECGVRTVLLFGSSTGYPVSDQPVREDAFWDGPVHPAYHGYGWMRRYVERLGEFAATATGVRVVIVRPGAVYGPRDNFSPSGSHVIAALIRRAVAREAPFTVWGSGREERDVLHVRDLVRGCLLALEKAESCDPINIAAGRSVTVADLARAVLVAAEYPDADLRFDPAAPTTIPRRLIDIGKARRILGFEPDVSLADGLSELVHWFRAHEKCV